MRLFVGRHGFAGDPSPDPKKEAERPLKQEGRDAVAAVAAAMLKLGDLPKCIFCSNYQRAQETAYIYGKAFGVNVAVIGDLAPIRPLTDGLFSLMGSKEKIGRVMLVGHRDNTEPLFNDLDGPKFGKIMMGEVKRLTIDRKTGAFDLKWCIKPSDVGFPDHWDK